ncbi:MAG: glutamate racemase [Erysipelotrichaceae bacterium]
MKIGLIDSGLGGITILNKLRELNPKNDYLFFADQKNLPYGNKTKEELMRITKNNINFLLAKGADRIFFACNTISANCLEEIKELYPEVIISGIIDITCELLTHSSYQRILILATEATINNGAYLRELNKVSQAELIPLALPGLCKLIEDKADRHVIANYLNDFLSDFTNVDAIVLGCTHYPLVADLISEIIEADIFDSIMALEDSELLQGTGNGTLVIYSSGDKNLFEHKLEDFFHMSVKVQ